MLVDLPPMGWNSWNTFSEAISADLIKEMTDKIVELGLDKVGYRYVVIDDCWSERERDPKTGKIVPDKKKFPKGMKDVSDYVHSKGLKFGMYSCCGVRTCANYPGSHDHEFLDAQTFAEYGCDFLKYDNCFRTTHTNTHLQYLKMGNALRATGRDILFSACEWGNDDVWSWIRGTGAHMFRSTQDIVDNMDSYKHIAESQVSKMWSTAPQCFNDLDMLTVGMYGKSTNEGIASTGCTESQYKQQFALWCLMSSPLFLGCDLRKIDKKTLELITNKELLAINQDPEVRPAFKAGDFADHGNKLLGLCKQLSNGDLAIGLFNFTDVAQPIYLMFENFGFPAHCGMDLKFKNIFTGKVEGVFRETYFPNIAPMDCEIYRVTPVKR